MKKMAGIQMWRNFGLYIEQQTQGQLAIFLFLKSMSEVGNGVLVILEAPA
jgi:hypothetical protein